MEEKKLCPYCGKEILKVAKKCKHCGEWLEQKEPEKEKKACPICGELVDVDLEVCPYCKESTHINEGGNEDKIVNDPPNVRENKGNIWKKKTFYSMLPIICLCIIKTCGFVIKKCQEEKSHKEHVELQKKLSQQWDDSVKQHTEKALRILTKSSWYGKNTIINHYTVDGWNIILNGVMSSKKTYMNNKKYIEIGTLSANFTFSNAYEQCKGECEIKINNSGVITIFDSSFMTEKTTNSSREIVSTRIVYNNTDADNEELAMNFRLILNKIFKNIKNSDEELSLHIETLTDTSLVLVEPIHKKDLLINRVKLTYKRNI